MATWRPLNLNDIPALMKIANEIHTTLPERPEIFAERIMLSPSGCLGLELESSKGLVGYTISHPIRRGEPPELDTLLGENNVHIDASASDAAFYIQDAAFYIHDVAILPVFRGEGYAAKGVRLLLGTAAARGFSVVCLVSVYGTEEFWGRAGFKRVEVDEKLRRKLEGYGGDAVYLEREGV
ncbi:acyl-CoA N-acyltransferase [Aspergillus carlsbadensis]|nr:acyl-CoA N-acyltransferase [Aspergillus carlsbadensis]